MSCIRDLMSQPAVAVLETTTLTDVVRCMEAERVGSLPVVSGDGAVVGIISEMALLDLLFDRELRDAPVSDVMERDVQVIHPDASLNLAVHTLALYGIRRLPVVENGAIVGIISRRELLNYAVDSLDPIANPLIELIPTLAQYT
jgi:CBS domain-containing protein